MPQTVLWGNLGRDGELCAGQNAQFLKLAVAEHVQKAGSGNGEEADDRQTIWWNVLVWQPMASALAPFMERGLRVCVMGRVDVSTWTDGEGAVRLNRTIIADAVGWQSKRKRAEAEAAETEVLPLQQQGSNHEDDDPFGDQ